ncbi:MAG: P-II family nitrogen regulator [Lachnospiraceae bacterium]|nr:P-II family nitrogen regulator [Lachnospiraceae bacterium]MCR5128795.1 P-II family nitrogen regulator [Lachnospiraceae bacterium]
MKRIVVVVNPEKKKKLESIFEYMQVGGVIISNIQGFGNQKGLTQQFRGNEMRLNYISKIQAETVVPDDRVEELIEDLLDELQTGEYGDGKIFVYDVCDVIRIRTGERGEQAL